MARVLKALEDLGDRNRLPEGQNPIRRANLGVAGVDSQLHVFEILGGDDVVHTAAGAAAPAAVAGPAGARHGDVRLEQGVRDASFRFMASELQRLRRDQDDFREEAACRKLKLQNQLEKMQKSLSRLTA